MPEPLYAAQGRYTALQFLCDSLCLYLYVSFSFKVQKGLAAMAKSEKNAAIELAELKTKRMSEIRADQLIDGLNAQGLLGKLPHWPEKKKYELWAEPEGNIEVGKLIDFLQEKKKYELELPPDLAGSIAAQGQYGQLLDNLTN